MENNPKYLPKDGDEIISRYQAILELAKTKTLEYFKALPAAELDIKPVEEFRAAASPAGEQIETYEAKKKKQSHE